MRYAFIPLALNILALPAQGKDLFRFESNVSMLAVSPSGRAVAFLDEAGRDLRFGLIKEKTVHRVTTSYVGPSFFWTKDGRHIVYREQSEISAKIFLFNTFTRTSELLKEEQGKIGYLSYDPLSETVLYLIGDTMRSLAVKSPSIRKGKWQKETSNHRFVVTASAALIVSEIGETKRLDDDRSGITSFAISPDGEVLAWATQEAKIYTASKAQPSGEFFDYGRDPSWHPSKHVLLYSGARLVGDKVVDYDIKEADLLTGEKFFLTRTQNTKERFPAFEPRKLAVWHTVEHGAGISEISFATPKISREDERFAALLPLFNPQPGQQLTLDGPSLGPKFSENPLSLTGQITVAPPTKVCLTITKNVEKRDETVCKKTVLTFRLSDLDPETGALSWKVQRSDESDLGTTLTWKTPYRFARVIETGAKIGEKASSPLVLTRCTSTKNEEGEKEIVLSTLQKDLTFAVSFPQKHAALTGPIVEPVKKEDKKDAPKKQEIAPERSWDNSWNLDYEGTYVMDGNRFRSSISNFPGRKSTECRYALAKGTKREARLECHNTGDYAFFSAPLSCF